MNSPDHYQAVILTKECQVRGYDEQGDLVLGNGERFKITPLGVQPDKFRSYKLRAVSALTFSGREWLLDGEQLEAYCSRQFASPPTSESYTRLFTAWTLQNVLSEDRRELLNEEYPSVSELRKNAVGVAWVEERFHSHAGQTRDPNKEPLGMKFGDRWVDMVKQESPPSKAFKPIFLSCLYRISPAPDAHSAAKGVSHIMEMGTPELIEIAKKAIHSAHDLEPAVLSELQRRFVSPSCSTEEREAIAQLDRSVFIQHFGFTQLPPKARPLPGAKAGSPAGQVELSPTFVGGHEVHHGPNNQHTADEAVLERIEKARGAQPLFSHDVFLSHSSKDKSVVRVLAERLRRDGLKVWFDEWEIRPGDNIPAKIDEGLEHSRVLVLCMSANAFGSDWLSLEAGTFRFRDPLNKERRFIPLRLDDAPIKGSLAQFHYIDWRPADHEPEYEKLRKACSC